MEEPEKLTFLATLLPLSVILFIIVLGVLLLNQQFNKKIFRQKLDAEKFKIYHQKELLRSSIQVQEDERKRIARNLHDELGATLSMIRMRIMNIEKRTGEKELLEKELLAVREMTEVALSAMRRITHEILPPQLEAFGLVKTLEATAETVSSLGVLRMEIESADSFPRFENSIELGLYRIVMELLNNTIKHANASEIRIVLAAAAGDLRLSYSDNGSGFSAEKISKGIGRKSMEARSGAIGGKIAFEKTSSGGMCAVVYIPAEKLKKSQICNNQLP